MFEIPQKTNGLRVASDSHFPQETQLVPAQNALLVRKS
jgi:hypothetical protein